jgi:hypothetical protein
MFSTVRVGSLSVPPAKPFVTDIVDHGLVRARARCLHARKRCLRAVDSDIGRNGLRRQEDGRGLGVPGGGAAEKELLTS